MRRLSGVNERPMIIRMTTSRRQQRYDHRLRDLVHSTGQATIATDLGVPRSTAHGWLRTAPRVAVTLDVTKLKTSELQQEILELRQRVRKLTALLRLALALLRSSGFRLTHERLPMDAPRSGSSEPWIAPVSLSHCGPSCGSCNCPRVGSMPGDDCSTRVRWTISRRARAGRPID
jgi:hypothetical protein